MDPNGYPDDVDLKRIETWDAEDFYALMDFIRERWHYANSGYFRKDKKYYYLSTAGWSGNESIIEALERNFVFWSYYWESSNRGGHYVFRRPRLKGR